MVESGGIGSLQNLLKNALAAVPPRSRLVISGEPGLPAVLPEGSVEDADRLRDRHRHIGVRGGLARQAMRLDLRLRPPLGSCVRLCGQQPFEVLVPGHVLARAAAELLTGRRVALRVDGQVQLAGHFARKFQSHGAAAVPAARCLTLQARIQVIATGGPLRLTLQAPPYKHVLRQCLIAMRLAGRMGLDDDAGRRLREGHEL